MLKKIVAEFLGTFFLVFAGTGAIIINQEMGGVIGHLGIAFTFGLVVMAMIYALGEISGAHLNPAVSIAFWAAGKFPLPSLWPYLGIQVAGALAASALLGLMFPANEFLGATLPAESLWQAAAMEFVLSFFLMYVILNVSTGAKETGIMAGAAVGATVGLEALFGGPVSGASMNPARSIGPALVSGQLEFLWMYILVPVVAMLAAVGVCKFTKPDDCCPAC